MSADTLYEDDIVAWSERQAAGLRELAAARPALSNAIDWTNLIEEVESVGRSQISAVDSKMTLVFAHLMKAVSDPTAPSVGHWRSEVIAWQIAIARDFTASMRARLDIERIWTRARRLADASLREHGARLSLAVPETCPLPLDALVAEDADIDALLRAVAGARGSLARDDAPPQI